MKKSFSYIMLGVVLFGGIFCSANSLANIAGLASAGDDTITLVPTGAVWKYNSTGIDMGTSWMLPDFNDSAWPIGPAKLGFGEGNEVTVIINNHQITVYFRHSFTVADAAAISDLGVRLLRDDGAVVYLNGAEVFRSNMPAGSVYYDTLAASAAAGPDENTFFTSTVPASVLVNGHNVLAVEVHQSSSVSGDLGFDLELLARTGAASERELHAVGIYSGVAAAGGSSRNHEQGIAAVVVNRPGKRVTLFLSAYEPVEWRITTTQGTTIEKVILAGIILRARRAWGLKSR